MKATGQKAGQEPADQKSLFGVVRPAILETQFQLKLKECFGEEESEVYKDKSCEVVPVAW